MHPNELATAPGQEPSRRWMDGVALVLGTTALFLWAGLAWRERFLCDDAFISFRYADHLARGMGLVWNAGERVEGYTNFLWVLLMSAGLKLGLAPEKLSQLLGLASGLGLLVIAFRSGGSGSLGRLRGALIALGLAVHGSFAAWSTSGLETMFFTLLVWTATRRYLVERNEPERVSGWVSPFLFALATLTRPEGALFAGIVGLGLALENQRGRAGLRPVLRFGLGYALPIAAHVLWRHSYYGDWLPNTFRAKVPGAWLEQGLAYLGLYEREYHALAFVPFALLAFLGQRRREAGLIAVMLAAYLGYVLAVGGDRFEFRFLVVVLPHFTWLVVEGLSALALRPVGGVARVAQGALAVVALRAFLGLTRRGFGGEGGAVEGVSPVVGVRAYCERRMEEGRFLRACIERGELPAELVLCVGGAGALPYYTRWTTVDRRGLNDAHIARLPLDERGVVAHVRDAPYEYLEVRRVAVFDYKNGLLRTREQAQKVTAGELDGRPLLPRAVELGEQLMVFATFLPEDELRELFAGHEVLGGP